MQKICCQRKYSRPEIFHQFRQKSQITTHKRTHIFKVTTLIELFPFAAEMAVKDFPHLFSGFIRWRLVLNHCKSGEKIYGINFDSKGNFEATFSWSLEIVWWVFWGNHRFSVYHQFCCPKFPSFLYLIRFRKLPLCVGSMWNFVRMWRNSAATTKNAIAFHSKQSLNISTSIDDKGSWAIPGIVQCTRCSECGNRISSV